jgi:hypothetical protein
MNWFTHPDQLCATIDMDTQDGLVEAMMIAIASIKDDEGVCASQAWKHARGRPQLHAPSCRHITFSKENQK